MGLPRHVQKYEQYGNGLQMESIRSLFRGYISLGSREIQVKSFDYVTSSDLKWSTCSQTWVFLLMRHLEILQILKRWTHLRNGQVNKASSINSGLAKICLVMNNWSRIDHCWLWVALICFHLALVRFDLLAISVQLKDKYLFSTPMKIHTMIGTVRKQENVFLVH